MKMSPLSWAKRRNKEVQKAATFYENCEAGLYKLKNYFLGHVVVDHEKFWNQNMQEGL